MTLVDQNPSPVLRCEALKLAPLDLPTGKFSGSTPLPATCCSWQTHDPDLWKEVTVRG